MIKRLLNGMPKGILINWRLLKTEEVKVENNE